MKLPKTRADLPRRLREQFDLLQHVDWLGLSDHAKFDGFDVAALVNECQRVTCGFGAPLVSAEQTDTSVRAGLEIIGKLLAWAEPEPEALTVKQAADRLGVSLRTVYDLVKCGRLKCQRIGTGRGTIRIRPFDLERLTVDTGLKHL
jgi:excisionase family DNA binding protein